LIQRPGNRRLDVCGRCSADVLDILDGREAGFSPCKVCGSVSRSETIAITPGNWSFSVVTGPAGLALRPHDDADGRKLAEAARDVADYVRDGHTGCDGYDLARHELLNALTMAFQTEPPWY
jgi:hypothetical protein